MVWGHVIENFKDGIDFWHNPVWECIYSFHMPLFYIISGFFFHSSLSLSFKDFLRKKGLQLLLPYFSWLFLGILYRFIISLLKKSIAFNWIVELKGLLLPFDVCPWFLRELFISYFVVYVAFKIVKRWHLALVISIGFALTAPYFSLQRFLLPMFWIGIALAAHYQFLIKYATKIICISILVFGICLFFWTGDYTIYVTGFPSLFRYRQSFELGIPVVDISKIPIALFRMLTGVSGSIMLFTLAQKFYKEHRITLNLSRIGTYSMGIYILHIYILYKCLGLIIDFPHINELIYSIILAPLISLFVTIGCILICKLIHKNKRVELILFGRIQ